MNNNTNKSDIPEEVLELVPWYAIGKLSVDDQTFFDNALAQYPLLKEYVAQEMQIIDTVSADKSLLEMSALAPQEEHLKSVLNMIDIIERQEKIQQTNETNKNSFFIEKFKGLFDILLPSSGGNTNYTRITSTAVVVLSVAVLTAFVAPLFTDKSDYIPASAVNQQNTSSSQTSMDNKSSTKLLVGFNGSSADLGANDVLKDRLLKIETVPNKAGIYQISFKRALSPAEIEETIAALLAQQDLIWFAGEEF